MLIFFFFTIANVAYFSSCTVIQQIKMMSPNLKYDSPMPALLSNTSTPHFKFFVSSSVCSLRKKRGNHGLEQRVSILGLPLLNSLLERAKKRNLQIFNCQVKLLWFKSNKLNVTMSPNKTIPRLCVVSPVRCLITSRCRQTKR